MLASAVSYALKAAALVRPADMTRPTPCAGWTLDDLLRHLCDSVAALDEAFATGRLGPEPAALASTDLVEVLRDRAAELLCSMFTAQDRTIQVASLPVPDDLIIAAGAVEIAVHGWDVYVTCGHGRVVPAALARPLIRMFPLLITERQGLFASPVATPPCASPGDRMVAFLGRDPAGRRRR